MNDLKTSFSKTSILKGQEVNLTERDPALHRAVVALGWDVPEQQDGHPVDLDASAFLLNRDNRVRQDTDFVFYNNTETENSALKHIGDSVSGDSEGDDEEVHIDLDALPYDVERVSVSVTIHDAEERQQNFGIVKNAYIRIYNGDTKMELARFDLSEDASEYNGFVFGELCREGAGWKFKAVGTGTKGGLYQIARDYGVNVAPP